MAYIVPDEFITPPPADHLQDFQTSIYIKHVEIRGKMVRTFTYERLQISLLTEYLISTHQAGPQVIDRLMTVSFKQEYRDQPDCSQEVLKRGVALSGAMFRFLGHSNSQLKDKTCYLMAATDEEIHDLLAQFADFSKIPSIAKRAKRIGLLFSSFNKSLSLHEEEYEVIPDIKSSQYNFTDGCGFMSEGFAREIQGVHRLNHVPCVVQIRYQGYKGVLVISPEMTGFKVQFRESMKKFSIPDDEVRRNCSTFGVVEYSKPFSKAFLNTQLTMVLADNGTLHGYLLELQRNCFSMFTNLCLDEEEALRYLTITGNERGLERLKQRGLYQTQVQKELGRMRNEEIRKMMKDEISTPSNQNESESSKTSKLRVLVPKARVVFGVCDPYGELEYGEVFFQPTLPDGELFEFLNANLVIVGRNPCYHPGDVRVLKLVHAQDKPRYVHLYDCIVFPTKGSRPHPDECSGGDLDGDKFFVSWDRRLIPGWITYPFHYDVKAFPDLSSFFGKIMSSVFSPVSKGVSAFGRSHIPSIFGTEGQAEHKRKIRCREELLEYFANFNNNLVSLVDRVFMKYASRHGPSCEVCVYLNKYFSDAVDMVANKKAIEGELERLERDFHRRRDGRRVGHANNNTGLWETSTSLPSTNQSRHIVRRQVQQPVQKSRFVQVVGFLQPPPTKDPFKEGDDVWTTMERKSEEFVKRMKKEIR